MKLDLPAPDAPLSSDDLRRWTNAMIDTQLALIADATDTDVVFEPVDPEANDTHAASEAEVHLPWSLGISSSTLQLRLRSRRFWPPSWHGVWPSTAAHAQKCRGRR